MTIATSWLSLEASGDWEPALPEKRVDAAFAKVPAAPELRELYRHADGGSLGGVDIFQLYEFKDVNGSKAYRKTFPGAVFFASDGGDRFFFIDTTGALARGAGAIIMTDRSAADPQLCTFVTANFDELLSALSRGEQPWQGKPTLGAAETADLLAVLAASSGKYSGARYEGGLVGAEERCGVRVPDSLAELLRKSDGMRIPAARVTIWPARQLDPIPGIIGAGDYPALIWFAADDDGNRYAIAATVWRDVVDEDVVCVARGADPASAPKVGTFATVVMRWLKQ